MTKRDKIYDYLEGLSRNDLVAIYNQYCEEANYTDDLIEDNGQGFIETYYSDVWSLACQLDGNNNYSIRDDYVRFDGLGNLESTDTPEDWIDLDEIAEYSVENDEYFGDTEIKEILEEEESDDEEDE